MEHPAQLAANRNGICGTSNEGTGFAGLPVERSFVWDLAAGIKPLVIDGEVVSSANIFCSRVTALQLGDFSQQFLAVPQQRNANLESELSDKQSGYVKARKQGNRANQRATKKSHAEQEPVASRRL
jgi:hypothetical protein